MLQEICGGAVQVQARELSQPRRLRWRDCRSCVPPKSTRFQVKHPDQPDFRCFFCPKKRPKITESFNYNPSNNSMCTDCPKYVIEFSD